MDFWNSHVAHGGGAIPAVEARRGNHRTRWVPVPVDIGVKQDREQRDQGSDTSAVALVARRVVLLVSGPFRAY